MNKSSRNSCGCQKNRAAHGSIFQLSIVVISLILISGCGILRIPETPTPVETPMASPLEGYQRGLDLLPDNDFSSAADQFQQAIEIDPEFGPAYSGMALALLWEGERFDVVLSSAELGGELAPESAFAQSVITYVRLFQHLPLEALASAERALQLDPEDPFVQMVAVLALVENYQYERAWEVLETAYAQNSENPEVYIAFGVYYSAADDFGRALAAFTRSVELAPEFIPWQQYLAEFYFSATRYADFDQVLEQILALDPGYLPALMLGARADLLRFDHPAAEEKLAAIDQILPDSIYSNFLQADLHYFKEKYLKAMEYYNRALDLSPDSYPAAMAIGAIYLQQGECNKASTTADQITQRYLPLVELTVFKGYVDLCLGDAQAALMHFQEAQQINPFSQEALLGMAEVFINQEQWQQAEEVLLLALKSSQSLSDVHLSLARLQFSQGYLSSAEGELRIALVLNPFDIDTYCFLSEVLFRQSRLPEAMDVIEEAAELNPFSSRIQQMQGFLTYFSGNPSEALDILEQAFESDPQNPKFHLFKALALRDLERFPQAAASIETYLSLLDKNKAYTADIFAVERLLQEFNDGYQISREIGLARIEDELRATLGYTPRIFIESNSDQGDTLVIDLVIQPSRLENQAYLYELSTIVEIAGMYLPRFVPAVENGLLVDVNTGSRAVLDAHLSSDDLKFFADTLYSADELVDRIAVDLPASIVQRNSITTIIQDVAALRNLEFNDSPDYGIISVEEFSEQLTADFDKEYLDELEKEFASLVMLGLISPEVDFADLIGDYLSSTVAGFYSTSEEKIYVVSNDRLTSLGLVTLAHECEHAIVDDVFNLSTIQSRTTDTDRNRAALALVEGDATLLSNRYLNHFIPEIGRWAASAPDSREPQGEAQVYPAYLIQTSNFPYTYGKEFVSYLFDLGGWKQVDEAFWDPPISTEQIMHPQKYLDQQDPIRVYLNDVSAAFESDWDVFQEDMMGELGTFLTLAEFFGETAARPAAEGWGGDRFMILENKADGERLLVWRTVWDDSAEARQFWESISTAMVHRSEYQEQVEDYSRTPKVRVWHSREGYLEAFINEDEVIILVGDTFENLESIYDVFN